MNSKSGGRRKGAAAAGLAAAALIAGVVAFLLLAAPGGSNGSYTVRAIFDDAANLTVGEDVKIAGAKVGKVGTVEPTPEGKAAVSLHIENPGFQDFRADASCEIAPQSLLGEQYVNCSPTQPRPEGAPLPPPLKRIPSGRPGAGQWLLPLANTSSPVGVDQLQNMTRMPEEQRLRIILNELGATFADRGPELHEVILRANPGLKELEKVLDIFASQNKLLANLAVESNRALAPIAADRAHVEGFITHSSEVSAASERHLPELEEDLKGFPAFLRQLGPATERIGQFAEATTPTAKALSTAAPAIDRAFEDLPAFSRSSSSYLISLGSTAKVTGPALKAATPLLNRLEALGAASRPFASSFAELLAGKHGIRETGGLERIMDFIYLGAGTTNGYDKLGHFLRAEVVGDICVSYVTKPNGTCPATFHGEAGSVPAGEERAPSRGRHGRAAAASSGEHGASASSGEPASASSRTADSAAFAKARSVRSGGLIAERTIAVLEGASPAQAIAEFPGPEEGAPSKHSGQPTRAATPVGGAASKTTYYTPGQEPAGVSARLLEYLLGG